LAVRPDPVHGAAFRQVAEHLDTEAAVQVVEIRFFHGRRMIWVVSRRTVRGCRMMWSAMV
jgi:hypothetical protein